MFRGGIKASQGLGDRGRRAHPQMSEVDEAGRSGLCPATRQPREDDGKSRRQ